METLARAEALSMPPYRRSDLMPAGDGIPSGPEALGKRPDKVFALNSDFQASLHKGRFRFSPIVFNDRLNLAQGALRITGFAVGNDLDTIFFLDKSGRPAGYLFLKVWDKLYPGFKPPQIKFINIGREAVSELVYPSPKLAAAMRKTYSNLHGQNVGIIDEYVDTGSSLYKARNLIGTVFPEIKRINASGMFKYPPCWHGVNYMIGVRDSEIYADTLSKPYLATAWRGDATSDHKNFQPGNVLDATRALRRDLSTLARLIADNVTAYPVEEKRILIKPYLPSTMDKSNRQELLSDLKLPVEINQRPGF